MGGEFGGEEAALTLAIAFFRMEFIDDCSHCGQFEVHFLAGLNLGRFAECRIISAKWS